MVATLIVGECASLVTTVLQSAYGLELSGKKSKALGSTAAATRALVRNTTCPLRPAKQAKMLGAGMAGGRKRTVATLRQRLAALRPKFQKCYTLRAIGARTSPLVNMCLTASATYGNDTHGSAPTAVYSFRSQCARAASPDTFGRKVDTTLLGLEAAKQGADPTAAIWGLSL